MSHIQHKLKNQLPEFAEKIKMLKKKDKHFAKLAKRYSKTNRKINKYETGVENTSDFHLEDLKKKRLYLLDIIRHILINTDDSGKAKSA